MNSDNFYRDLPLLPHFSDAVDASNYQRLPEDWMVAVCDVVGSTRAIHAGRYKSVNMAGAAAISALKNVFRDEEFPFVFGGDGSTAAFPKKYSEEAASALMETRTFVEEELDLRLRVGLMAVRDIRASGRDVLVARYRASAEMSYAMIAGGGVAWAEKALKSGEIELPDAPKGSRPDLTGLSCRWAPINSKSGVILSVLAEPVSVVSMFGYTKAVETVLDMLDTAPRNGHPVPNDGPDFPLLSEGIKAEVSARGLGESAFLTWLTIRLVTFFGYFLNATGMKARSFDMRRYRRVVSRNSDFRKFEDGLRLTVDVEEELADKIEACLLDAEKQGVLHCGFARQDAALMTCIVPSYTDDDHMHFIDGAGGGYASAALRLKEKLKAAAK